MNRAENIVSAAALGFAFWLLFMAWLRAILDVDRKPDKPERRTVVRKDGIREIWCENDRCHKCPHLTVPLPQARARSRS